MTNLGYCINSVSSGYAVVSVIGLVILSYVALRPEKVRQKSADDEFKEESFRHFLEESKQRFKLDYRESPTKGYGGIREEDLPLWTEEYYINRRARDEFENIGVGRLKYQPIFWTDTRIIVLGTILSVSIVPLQLFFPAC